jgi:hypothetical protein
VKPVGEPDAVAPHVRFDERGWETGRCRMAQATAPILDSTIPAVQLMTTHDTEADMRGMDQTAEGDPMRTPRVVGFVCRNRFLKPVNSSGPA